MCLATPRGLYRLGETVGLCQARAADVGFIKYQVGCDGLRDTGGGHPSVQLAHKSRRDEVTPELAYGAAVNTSQP